MNAKEMLSILHTAEKLKTVTRHSWLSDGRHESVAEHSWRLALMAFLLEDQFPEADMGKVIRMCLIHDLGEIFTGDIPAFYKKESDSVTEEDLLNRWIETFPVEERKKWQLLFREMHDMKSFEARLYKALDKIEAVIQHDEGPIEAWLPLEYELQQTYGQEYMDVAPFIRQLRDLVDEETRDKIRENRHRPEDEEDRL